ncbi:MAG: hypothetical protein ABIZ18_06530, partial [Caldimonas sp.]
TRKDFAPSWDCLRRVGNMSSASVLLVLEDFMLNRRPPAGTYSILAATGRRGKGSRGYDYENYEGNGIRLSSWAFGSSQLAEP